MSDNLLPFWEHGHIKFCMARAGCQLIHYDNSPLTHFRAIGVKILLNISNWKSHLLAQYSGHTHTTPVPFDFSDPP